MHKLSMQILFSQVSKVFEGGDGRTLVLLSKNCILFDFSLSSCDALLQFYSCLFNGECSCSCINDCLLTATREGMCQAALLKYWFAWVENSIITYHLIQIIFHRLSSCCQIFHEILHHLESVYLIFFCFTPNGIPETFHLFQI